MNVYSNAYGHCHISLMRWELYESVVKHYFTNIYMHAMRIQIT
jgi:hypothetical protein